MKTYYKLFLLLLLVFNAILIGCSNADEVTLDNTETIASDSSTDSTNAETDTQLEIDSELETLVEIETETEAELETQTENITEPETSGSSSTSQNTTQNPIPPSTPVADANGDGVITSEEHYEYISPSEQACINAGYGNVVCIDPTFYAVLVHGDGDFNGKMGGEILLEYLWSIGMDSYNVVGGWINAENDYYMVEAHDCFSLQ